MKTCTQCGMPMPGDSPEGLCPSCLLSAAMIETVDSKVEPSPGEGATIDSPREGAGAIIGNYKLLQLIGEGGFGSVFMAEQLRPVRRRVALKIIKRGMDTRQVIARFEAERQALAIMDHPNIARILDAGETATGRPFFVMELVKGIRITEYCDANKLATEARLELFVAVCNALQHAHQKGIIHRDIKPSNILITLHDGKPVPKLIDFGIAKATQSRLTEMTLFTEFRQMIGTPAYMSPEQAEMSGLDVDTRSDIYSLGVLLYELLTGTTPFDPRELFSAAYGEIQRIIREVEPPKPSTRLSTLGEPLTAIAANRGADPRKLSRRVRGELDWIVMKALEKDRTRRYESAGELARDVGRHLHDEPVEASPPGTIYRLNKFVKRNRVTVYTTAAVLTVVIVAGATYIHGIRTEQHKTELALIDARSQRAEAQKQKQVADRQRDEARMQERIATAVNEFLSSMLGSADPDKMLGDKVTVVQAIEAAQKQLDTNAGTIDPRIQASLRNTIGKTLRELGRYEEAEPNLRKSLALTRLILPEVHPLTERSVTDLAILLEDQNRSKEAEQLFREALAICRQGLPAGDPTIAQSMNNLAVLLANQNRQAEAEKLFREALGIRRKALPADDPMIAISAMNLGGLLASEDNAAEAEPLYREALRIDRKTLPPGHPDIAKDLTNLARLMPPVESEKLYREALEIDRKALPAGHPDIALLLYNLATVLAKQNRVAEAEPLYREALEIQRKTLPAAHPNIGRTLNNLAGLLQDQGRTAEAEPLFRESLDIFRKAPGGDIAQSLEGLGIILRTQNKLDEAEKLIRESLDVRLKTLPPGHPNIGSSLYNLALVIADRNRPEDAEKLCREALGVYRKAEPSGGRRTVACINNLAILLARHNKLEEAERLFREALEIDRKALPAGHPEIGKDLNNLGYVLVAQNNLQEAEPMYREALQIRRRALPAGHRDVVQTLYNLARLLVNSGRPDEAEPLYREALDIDRKALPAGDLAIATDLVFLANLLVDENKPKEAETLYRESLDIRRKALPAGDPLTVETLQNLVSLLTRAKRFADLEPPFRELLTIYGDASPPDPLQIARGKNDLGSVLSFQKKYAEAEPLLREALATRQEKLGMTHADTKLTVDALAALLDHTGRADEAKALRATHGFATPATRPATNRTASGGSTTEP